MPSFNLTLSQRDSVISLFTKLNSLIWLNNLRPNAINECALAIDNQINVLKSLKRAGGERSNGVFGSAAPESNEPIERPAKRIQTGEMADRVIFEIDIGALVNITNQIQKNQMTSIIYSNLNSMNQADKLELLKENNVTIEQLHSLSLVKIDKESSAAASRSDSSFDSISTGESKQTDAVLATDEQADRSLEIIDLVGDWDVLVMLDKFGQNGSTPTSQVKSEPKWEFETASRPNNLNASSEGPADPIGLTPMPATNSPSTSAPDQAAGRSSAAVPILTAIPTIASAQDLTPKSEAVLDFWLEGVQHFFEVENQQRRTTNFTISDGVTELELFFRVRVSSTLQSNRKYLEIRACLLNTLNCEARVLVAVKLFSQVTSDSDKQRESKFKFNQTKKENGYRFFATYEDLEGSCFLKDDRLHFQLTCELGSTEPLPEPRVTRGRSV